VSLLGNIRGDRAYYHCKSCRKGFCPGDAMLGVSRSDATPAATEVVSMAGVLGAFAQAAEMVLTRMCGLRLSESTVQRLTENVGADLGQRLADVKLSARPCRGPGTRMPKERRAPMFRLMPLVCLSKVRGQRQPTAGSPRSPWFTIPSLTNSTAGPTRRFGVLRGRFAIWPRFRGRPVWGSRYVDRLLRSAWIKLSVGSRSVTEELVWRTGFGPTSAESMR